MNTLSKSEVAGFTVSLELDPEPQSPREWTHGAELALSHKRYDLPNDSGIDFDALDSWADAAHVLHVSGALLVVPVYMLDHSGLAFRTGASFADPWDSGQVGYAYVTRQNWADTQGTEWTGSEADVAQARALADSDVADYGRYVNGEAYGYVVTDDSGEVLDSLWGFDDPEDAEHEGAAAAESLAESLKWPAGKTFGELTPEQKRWAGKQAAKKLQAELEANAETITALLQG